MRLLYRHANGQRVRPVPRPTMTSERLIEIIKTILTVPSIELKASEIPETSIIFEPVCFSHHAAKQRYHAGVRYNSTSKPFFLSQRFTAHYMYLRRQRRTKAAKGKDIKKTTTSSNIQAKTRKITNIRNRNLLPYHTIPCHYSQRGKKINKLSPKREGTRMRKWTAGSGQKTSSGDDRSRSRSRREQREKGEKKESVWWAYSTWTR